MPKVQKNEAIYLSLLWEVLKVILSSHFKHCITAICTAIVFLVAGWYGLRHIVASQPQGVALRPQDQEHITYSSTPHILTVTTDKGTTRSYTRNPDILIEKNGAVIVKKHLAGFEHAPFMAIGASFDGLSLKKNGYFGVNLVELWRFDLGPALAIGEIGVRPLAQIQYNFYSNSSIMVGWFPGVYHIGLAIKF
jgi:hypothetical protein